MKLAKERILLGREKAAPEVVSIKAEDIKVKLEKAKEEPVGDGAMNGIEQWANGREGSNPIGTVEACSEDHLVMPADAFAFNGEEEAILGALQTRDGLRFKWDRAGHLRVYHTEDGVEKLWLPAFGRARPIITWMHDECIVRHKGTGRFVEGAVFSFLIFPKESIFVAPLVPQSLLRLPFFHRYRSIRLESHTPCFAKVQGRWQWTYAVRFFL